MSAILALAAAQALALPAVPVSTVDYTKPANWLCYPGRTDVCTTPLPTVAVNPNGYGSNGLSTVAKDPGIDCFVVYPTVSRDTGMNSDLVPGENEEKATVRTQFARFASACRMVAPMYRSMTLSAVAVASAGGDVMKPGILAYSDVRKAWKHYLATMNKGRPYVLIGHSQGSLMLQQLIANEIEGKPEAARMKLAIIPGFNVFVPEGKTVGGTFKKTPLCTSSSQTGCVLTWASFREKNVPPPGAIFGIAPAAGLTVACTNPAAPESRDWVTFDSYWNARSTLPVPGGPIQWSSEGPVPAPYARTEGLASGKCVNDGPRGYLSIRTNADPNDKRTDRIGGEVGMVGMFVPGWGMHLADMNVAQGDLVARIEQLNAQARTGARQAR